MLTLEHNFIDKVKLPGTERAALWDAYEIPVHQYMRELRELEQEIRYCKTRYPGLYRQLKAAKSRLMYENDHKLDRIWNDQKTGTVFKRGEVFEPHHVTIVGNLVVWEGVTGFTEMIAGEISDFFIYKAMGKGITRPNFGNQVMELEIARVDMNINGGGINSDGIVLRDQALFPPGVETATISEFGAFDNDAGGRMEYHVTIEKVEDRLSHVVGLTEVQSSHTIVFQAVENKVV